MTEAAFYLKPTPSPEQFIVKRTFDDKYIGNVHDVAPGQWVATVKGREQFDGKRFPTAEEAAEALTLISL